MLDLSQSDKELMLKVKQFPKLKQLIESMIEKLELGYQFYNALEIVSHEMIVKVPTSGSTSTLVSEKKLDNNTVIKLLKQSLF